MSKVNHRTQFSCKKKKKKNKKKNIHKDNPQTSKIMYNICYCLQNVINEIDFNKFRTFISQSGK